METKVRNKPCPKGFHRNQKTGECNPKKQTKKKISSDSSKNLTRRSNTLSFVPAEPGPPALVSALDPDRTVSTELALSSPVAPEAEAEAAPLADPNRTVSAELALSSPIAPEAEPLADPDRTVSTELALSSPVAPDTMLNSDKPESVIVPKVASFDIKPPQEKKRTRCKKGTRWNGTKCVSTSNKTLKNSRSNTNITSVLPAVIEPASVVPAVDEIIQTTAVEPPEAAEAASPPQENKVYDQASQEMAEYKASLTETTNIINKLYPTLDDANFAQKIAMRKEFAETKYDGDLMSIEKQADILSNAKFELMPHQLFVRNFLSHQTPYNSLLLYHGLGSGKTCSAIGVAEEMRNYMRQTGLVKKIIVVASPSVQGNFRTQLFDEKNFAFENGEYNIDTCIGSTLLDEINPIHLKGLQKDKIISQINGIIRANYDFMGYLEFANYIKRKILISEDSGYSADERKTMELHNIRTHFDNRLVIIDEIQNIRITDDNKQKQTAYLLNHIAKYSKNMRLLLLSATPLYNSYKEIIWLVNLLNTNDKRATIKESDVFDKEGRFITNSDNKEGGLELLQRKLTGYVSYVRGENPYTFPYRIYPAVFAPDKTLSRDTYPTIQMNNKSIDDPIQFIPVYSSQVGEYQAKGYSLLMKYLINKSFNITTAKGVREMPLFEEMESFGYTVLFAPIEALNIVYPNEEIEYLFAEEEDDEGGRDLDENVIAKSIGKTGLESIMKHTKILDPPMRYNFEYKGKKNGNAKKGHIHRIFAPDEIGKYSGKIAEICRCIRQSKGIVLVYSQFIDGGIVPMALALEEMGFARHSSTPSHNKNLFAKMPTSPIDAVKMQPRKEMSADEPFHPAKYVMITGDIDFSPNNTQDVKYASQPLNSNGELVKVILISKAASEGLDFKCIRQIHIMDPWYNMNRIEQIIGRGVRNGSHKALPFAERNVEIYMHTSQLQEDSNTEAADLYIYRMAEKKAKQIGKITRVLKEVSVDCVLNISQNNFTEAKLKELTENQNIQIQLPSKPRGELVSFQVGDLPYTDICDYMDNCEYKCAVKNGSLESEGEGEGSIVETYNTEFMNNQIIEKRIRNLFKERTAYKREQLIAAVNIYKKYPRENILYVITELRDIVDPFGRSGYILNRGDIYAFQPNEIADETISTFERRIPIDYKREQLKMELNQGFESVYDKKLTQQKSQDNEQETEKTYDRIMGEIQSDIDLIYDENVVLTTSDINWFKHTNHIVKLLFDNHKLTEKDVNKYTIQHICDTLSLKFKLIIVNELFLRNRSLETFLEKVIYDYFNKYVFRYREKWTIVLSDGMKNKIFIENTEIIEGTQELESQFTEVSTEDFIQISTKLSEFEIPRSKIDNTFGFMHSFKEKEFKDKEIVFKIKEFSQKKNNRGERCSSKNTTDIIKLINDGDWKSGSAKTGAWYPYEATQKIRRMGFCVILEILMREYMDKYDASNKIVFFDTVSANFNRVENL